MNRLSKYKDFTQLKSDFGDVYKNINIDILDNLDQLTQDFNDKVHMEIIKNMQVIISMGDQFILNKWEFTKRINILGFFKNEEFIKEPIELTYKNLIPFKQMLDDYDENGLFYRVAIMTKDNNDFLDNGEEEYFAFGEESEKLIPILENCSKRVSRLNKIKFNGVFVAYYSGLRPKWYPSEVLKNWMIDIEDVNDIRSIQLYFQDKNIIKI